MAFLCSSTPSPAMQKGVFLVWAGLERLVEKLKPYDGRIFVSHNVKFCSRFGGDELCKEASEFGT
ncbi:hypothetical protein DY000_02043880 [Brassica cretica]|uniref:Uncharacterized protein n=1 Tax=Brassica cretica TaxID=69181 RepID=A0ABQ7BCK4_BRACR|nr:hypothetical protein DY000_02043880 [Brassica cretica]